MNIYNIEKQKIESIPETFRVSAEISYSDGFYEKCWFEFPIEKYERINEKGDPWLVVFLPLAMKLGEPIHIDAAVDSFLLCNLKENMRIWLKWYSFLNDVPVTYEEKLSEREVERFGKTAVFFSGGVDSFFALHHYDENHPDVIIDDLISVHGFDLPISKVDEYEQLRKRLNKSAFILGKNLVSIRTNIRETRFKDISWGYLGFGCALASVGLLLSNEYSSILAASDHTYEDLSPWGGHPLTFPNFSNINTRLIYYGCEFDRYQRLQFIGQSPAALDTLFVCWKSKTGANCCECNKCYRTMTALKFIGNLDRYTTFDSNKFNYIRLSLVVNKSPGERKHFEKLMVIAKEIGDRKAESAIKFSFLFNRLWPIIDETVKYIENRISYRAGNALGKIINRWVVL